MPISRIRRYSDVMALPDSFIQKQQLDASMADTFLEHLCLLDIDQEPITARNTSIICTIGPASRSITKLQEMVKAGMDIARLNFCYHGETIRNIRKAVETLTSDPLYYRPVAIALDTKGPEIRTGLVKGSADAEVMLERGASVRVVTAEVDRDKTDGSVIWIDYPSLPRVLKKGSRVFIDDGLLALKVMEIGETWVETRVENGGTLGSRKGVNLPGAELVNLPAVSDRDRADLLFGVEQDVDIIFASFIRSAEDVRAVREALGVKGQNIKIISKVESRQGVQNFEEILKESDGIMVARGDLGIEIPAEKVFIAQKMMIGRCNSAGKPVICATQVRHISALINKYKETKALSFLLTCFLCLHRVVYVWCFWTESLCVWCRSAHLLSRYRPRCPIIAVTRNVQVARQSQLLRGVFPALFRAPPADIWADDVDNRVTFAMDIGKARGFFTVGDMVIIVTGWSPGSGHTNIMRAVTVP
uniref:Pyruvate kinase n=1 Tax=Cyprinus carpio TaxID=7962 RepID=A0A8C2PR34_CYPCA